MTMNKMIVIGNVGSDPEMRYTPSGAAVTSFRVATNRRFTGSDGQQQEETEWFTVSAWNKLAETCNQYVTKGMKVYVEGRLHSRPYIAKDGHPRAGNEIIANDVRFLDRGGQGGQGGERPDRAERGPGSAPGEQVEDLPW
ncbi:MAG: single-stranded DNA-binding protein [SAR202 cluster bacterium]|nr:single-stranded DNA-binding protein [SAR202 cluster bacterium]